jgi:hypothetical protein
MVRPFAVALRLHAVLRDSLQSFRLNPPAHENSVQLTGPAERQPAQSSAASGVQDSPPATFAKLDAELQSASGHSLQEVVEEAEDSPPQLPAEMRAAIEAADMFVALPD